MCICSEACGANGCVALRESGGCGKRVEETERGNHQQTLYLNWMLIMSFFVHYTFLGKYGYERSKSDQASIQ